MNQRSILAVSALAATGLIAAGQAIAQPKALKDQLIGTWSLVSYDSIAADGTKKAVFGAGPKGYLMLDAGGRFTYILVDMSRAKWKGADRTQTTVDEYAAAAKGLVAQFGTWSADEASKTFVRKVEGALNPGLPGVEQKLTLGFSADEITLTDSTSQVTGGRTEQRYRRAK
jgi:hypothetical protein